MFLLHFLGRSRSQDSGGAQAEHATNFCDCPHCMEREGVFERHHESVVVTASTPRRSRRTGGIGGKKRKKKRKFLQICQLN